MAVNMTKRGWDSTCSDKDMDKKSGVGNTLKLWEKHCKEPGKMKTSGECDKAEETCKATRKALKKHQQLMGNRGDKQTQKLIKTYWKVLEAYEASLETAKGELQAGQDKSATMMAMLKRAKNEDLPFVFAHKGGGGELKLLKRKSEVKSAIVDARKQLSGAKIYGGTCKVQGGSKLILKFAGKKPPECRKVLKQILASAGTSMKPIVEYAGKTLEEEEEAQT